MDKILKYFPDLDQKQIEQFKSLGALYTYWNELINVISRKDLEHLYERHVLHSLAIAKVIQFTPGTRVLDVGTGGGFPGIPLAIMFPQAEFFLIDSIGKKVKVVNAVSENIGLSNLKAEHTRVQQVNESFDFVVSRAVTNLPDFFNWTRNKNSKKSYNKLQNGILYLKGGNFEDELKAINKKANVYNIQDFFEEEFFETKKLVHIY